VNRLRDRTDGASESTAVALLVAITVLVGGGVVVTFGDVADSTPERVPSASLSIEFDNVGDGVAKNDTVTVVHEGGDRLDRRHLEVRVGDDVVFNETADSESNSASNVVAGLVVEVDSDEFNDLNKPCRLSPADTCGGPPGDADGSDSGVVLQWETTVQSGQRLVIQERNAGEAYDVVRPGETVRVIYRGDDVDAVLAEATVPDP
jgi:FlaG/FlaF family flagellin (archaellin)